VSESQRTRLIGGVILILVGVFFLLTQFVPGWQNLFAIQFDWPLIIVLVGIFFSILGLLTGAPGMAVPAAIVGGIGGLLYWQNATGNWESWAYAWTLIPGFAGVGTILMGLLAGSWRNVREGLWTVIVSLILFAIFASFLGGPQWLGVYWPVLLILLGLLALGRAIFRGR
jgi:hypothetical protein